MKTKIFSIAVALLLFLAFSINAVEAFSGENKLFGGLEKSFSPERQTLNSNSRGHGGGAVVGNMVAEGFDLIDGLWPRSGKDDKSGELSTALLFIISPVYWAVTALILAGESRRRNPRRWAVGAGFGSFFIFPPLALVFYLSVLSARPTKIILKIAVGIFKTLKAVIIWAIGCVVLIVVYSIALYGHLAPWIYGLITAAAILGFGLRKYFFNGRRPDQMPEPASWPSERP